MKNYTRENSFIQLGAYASGVTFAGIMFMLLNEDHSVMIIWSSLLIILLIPFCEFIFRKIKGINPVPRKLKQAQKKGPLQELQFFCMGCIFMGVISQKPVEVQLWTLAGASFTAFLVNLFLKQKLKNEAEN